MKAGIILLFLICTTIWISQDSFATNVSTNKASYNQDESIIIFISLDPEEFTPIDVYIQNNSKETVYQTQLFHNRNDGKYSVTTTAAFPSGIYSVLVETTKQSAHWDHLQILPKPSISVSTDKEAYAENQTIKISGKASQKFNTPVVINLLTQNDVILKTVSTDLNYDMTFSGSMFIDASILDGLGIYKIRVIYDTFESEKMIEIIQSVSEPKSDVSANTSNQNNSSIQTPIPQQESTSQDQPVIKLPEILNKIIEKGRLTEDHVSLQLDTKQVEGKNFKPRIIQGSVLTPNNIDWENVNLRITTESGICVIGTSDECLVTENTRTLGGIYKIVEIDGKQYKIRYSGSNVKLEKFTIVSESLNGTLLSSNWNISVEKQEEQVSRLYYKIIYSKEQ